MLAVIALTSCHRQQKEDLVRSSRSGDLVRVDQLLKEGADPNGRINDYLLPRILGSLWLVAWAGIVWWGASKRGYLDLRPSSALKCSQNLISMIRNRKDSGGGFYVLRCPDPEWQAVVGEWVRNADCVIIDATYPSDNVLWETQQALKTPGPQRIVISYAVWADETPSVPVEIRQRLASVATAEELDQCAWFPYSRGVRPEIVSRSPGLRWRVLFARLPKVVGLVLLLVWCIWIVRSGELGRLRGLAETTVLITLLFLLVRFMQSVSRRLLRPWFAWDPKDSAGRLKSALKAALASSLRVSEQEVLRRRRRSIVRAVLALIGFYLVAVIILVILEGIRNRSTALDLVRLALSECTPLGIYFGARVFLRRTDCLILWLRRFHQGGLKSANFVAFLLNVSYGLAKPVTIRDTTHRTSVMVGILRNAVYLPLVSVAVLFGNGLIFYYATPDRALLDPVHDGNTSLVAAASEGHEAVVRRLIEAGARVNQPANDETALYTATESGYSSIAQLLIEHGADPNLGDRFSLPLDEAYLTGHKDIFLLLLEAKANPNYTPAGSEALVRACEAGDEQSVRLLLAAGADPNRKPKLDQVYPLEEAVRNGHDSIAELLLEHGAKTAAQDGEGRTALLSAADRGDRAMVERLLGAGAQPNSTAKYDGTPLHAAVKKEDLEIVQLLLAAGADPNALSSQLLGVSETPLHGARCNREIVSTLLAHGANPNLKAADGFSAFHRAAQDPCSFDILSMMLQHKADPDSSASEGGYKYTPLFWAYSSGNVELLRFLVNSGATDVGSDHGQRPHLYEQPSDETVSQMEKILEEHHSKK